MPKLIDLTGQRFDKLIVLEKAESRNRHVYWKCKCDCGRECEVSGESLRRTNQAHDCGICELKKTKQEEKRIQKKTYLIGKKFGKLTVIKNTGKSNQSGMIWLCKCDCGNFKEVPTCGLTSGHTQSCGCLQLESHLIDITNQKFGKLTALYFIPGESKWHCKCDCGNKCDIDSYNLKHLITQSCGCINYSIGEKNIDNILKENQINYIKEYTENSLKTEDLQHQYRFDFAIIKDNKILRLIEFDGEQHFLEGRGTWDKKDSLELRQQRDQEKNNWAKEHDIPLVRIPYWKRDNITLDMLLGDQYLITFPEQIFEKPVKIKPTSQKTTKKGDDYL